MNDVASRFKYTYYLNKFEFENRILTRIILSKKVLNLAEIDLTDGSAPIQIEDFTYKHAIEGSSTPHSGIKKHILEIGLDVDNDDCTWLYDRSTISTNDHSLANQREDMFGEQESFNSCHEYDTFLSKCPFPLSKKEADNFIRF